jgi:hypothetical protein
MRARGQVRQCSNNVLASVWWAAVARGGSAADLVDRMVPMVLLCCTLHERDGVRACWRGVTHDARTEEHAASQGTVRAVLDATTARPANYSLLYVLLPCSCSL